MRDTFSPSGVLKGETQVLEFSQQAQDACRNYTNIIESNLQPNYCLTDIPDAASKIGENMARIAAIFHILQGDDGEISWDTTQAAIAVSNWHLTQFKLLFGTTYQTPDWEKDAQILHAFIRDMAVRLNSSQFRKNDLRQRAPNRLRNKLYFESALNELLRRGVVQIDMKGKTTMVSLVPYPNFQQPAALPGVNNGI